MDASKILNDDMTLEEKLDAIEEATKKAQAKMKAIDPDSAPIDPAELTMCDSCQ